MTLQERIDSVKKQHEAAVMNLNRLKETVVQQEQQIYQMQGQYQLLEDLLKTENKVQETKEVTNV